MRTIVKRAAFLSALANGQKTDTAPRCMTLLLCLSHGSKSTMDDAAKKELVDGDESLEIMKKRTFFGSTRNRVLVGAIGVLTLVLIIIVPVVKLVCFKPEDPLQKAINLAAEAARYSVLKTNFPDPCLIEVDGSYHAFATRSKANASLNVQAASATEDIADWTLHEGYDALPRLPPWVKAGDGAAVWAPQVVQRPDGMFVMAYAAVHKDHRGRHCLGIATSATVLGPYDAGNATQPLLCHLELGGIIDPTFLPDPVTNNTYLIYKNDGNAIGSLGACGNSNLPNTPTTFQYSILTPDTWTRIQNSSSGVGLNGTEKIDNRTIFLRNTDEDGPNIESPQVWFQEYPANNKGAYHLSYNAGCFADSSYRTELLTCWLDDKIKSFIDCPWQELKKTSTLTLLKTGGYSQPDRRPQAVLMAPGGPGVSQNGKYMACKSLRTPVDRTVRLTFGSSRRYTS